MFPGYCLGRKLQHWVGFLTSTLAYSASFPPVSYLGDFVFFAPQGGIHGKISLTAYVVASLLETGVTSEVTETEGSSCVLRVLKVLTLSFSLMLLLFSEALCLLEQQNSGDWGCLKALSGGGGNKKERPEVLTVIFCLPDSAVPLCDVMWCSPGAAVHRTAPALLFAGSAVSVGLMAFLEEICKCC